MTWKPIKRQSQHQAKLMKEGIKHSTVSWEVALGTELLLIMARFSEKIGNRREHCSFSFMYCVITVAKIRLNRPLTPRYMQKNSASAHEYERVHPKALDASLMIRDNQYSVFYMFRESMKPRKGRKKRGIQI